MKFNLDYKSWYIDGREGVRFAFQTPFRIVGTLVSSIIIGVLFIMLIFPEYSYNLLSKDVTYIGYVLESLIELEYSTHGILGLLSVVLYAVFGGIVTVLTLGKYKLETDPSSSSLFGLLPGLFVAGCASCGAGIFGLLGVVGASAIFPFGGLGVRYLAVLVLVWVLVRSGNPRVCSL